MGNFSRDTFDKLKNYVGVRLQQGVPIVDADWNEMEDIRKHELRTFIQKYIGNGVPAGNDGFRILEIGKILSADGENDNFLIKGGSSSNPGRCLVDGRDVLIFEDIQYKKQPLYNNAFLASKWGVDLIRPLSGPKFGQLRHDLVYLDVWEREVDATEDPNLVNAAIGLETSLRIKPEWAVRVAEGATALPTPKSGHAFYLLAKIERPYTVSNKIIDKNIEDRRRTGLTMVEIQQEMIGARGEKINLNERLSVSLTADGKLGADVVGNDQVKPDAAINESKILFAQSGHDHGGGVRGKPIATAGLANNAVTRPKIKFQLINKGKFVNVVNNIPRFALIKEKVPLGTYLFPTISIKKIPTTIDLIPIGITATPLPTRNNSMEQVGTKLSTSETILPSLPDNAIDGLGTVLPPSDFDLFEEFFPENSKHDLEDYVSSEIVYFSGRQAFDANAYLRIERHQDFQPNTADIPHRLEVYWKVFTFADE